MSVVKISTFFTIILDGRMGGRAAREINTKANSAQLNWGWAWQQAGTELCQAQVKLGLAKPAG